MGTTGLLALVFGSACLLLQRQSLHGFDAFLALQATQTGVGEEAGHCLYFPLARAAWWLLRPTGCGAFEAMGVVSALAVAAAVAFAHRTALQLRLGRAAPWCAFAFGCTPAVLYFGATVEVDAPMLGMAAIAWWSAVRLMRRPTIGRACVTGVVTGIAACLHGGGQLLLVAIVVVVAGEAFGRHLRGSGRGRVRALLALGSVAGIVHGVVYVGVTFVMGNADQATMAGNTIGLPLSLHRLPTTLWSEWLSPFAPWSLLCFIPLVRLRSRWRWPAVALGVVWLGYLMLTNAVMGHFEPLFAEFRERGAFFVTLALPMSLLGCGWLRGHARIAAITAAAVVGFLFAHGQDWEPVPPGFEHDLSKVLERQRVWICCSGPEREFGWIRKLAGHVDAVAVTALPRTIAAHEHAGTTVHGEQMGLWFDLQMAAAAAAGASPLITEEALAWLQTAADPRLRHLAQEHLALHYRLEAAPTMSWKVWFVRRA